MVSSVLPTGSDRRHSGREAALYLGGTGGVPSQSLSRGADRGDTLPFAEPHPREKVPFLWEVSGSPELWGVPPHPPPALPWPPALQKHLWALVFASSSLAQSFPKMARPLHLGRSHLPCSLFLKFCLLLVLEHREGGLVAPRHSCLCVLQVGWGRKAAPPSRVEVGSERQVDLGLGDSEAFC